MIMADVLMWLLLILGLMLVFVSYWTATVALFPGFVARAQAQYARPIRLTFLGLVLAAPLVATALFLISKHNPAVALVGIVVISLPIVLGLAGSAGLCQRIGVGLASPQDESQPWRRVLRGGGVLTLTFLLPIFGWVGMTVWTLVTGFAAAALSFRPGRTDASPVSAMAAAPSSSGRTPPPIIATAREMAG